MKRIFGALFILIILFNAFGQSVIVEEDSKNVGGSKRKGLSTSIQLDPDYVSGHWKDFLKNYGRVSTSGNDFTVEAPQIPGIATGEGTFIYSTIKKERDASSVFMTIDLGKGDMENGSEEYAKAKEMLHKFGVEVYRSDVQIQIDDAENAVAATVKFQEKTIEDGKKLEQKIIKNTEEKQKLEMLLEQNKNEKVVLDSLVVQNQLDQKKMEEEVIKMKEALEIVKGKMNNIE